MANNRSDQQRTAALKSAEALHSRKDSPTVIWGLLSGLAAAFAAALYPILASYLASAIFQDSATSKSGQTVALVLISCVYAFITFSVVIWRSSRRKDIASFYALHFTQEAEEKEALQETLGETLQLQSEMATEYKSLTEAHSADRAFLEAAETAMDTLVQTLRTPLEKSWSFSQQNQKMSDRELHAHVLGILQYCSLLLEPDPRKQVVRCGLLVLQPQERFWFPLVTYDPDQEVYVSKTRIRRGQRPDWLIRRFENHTEAHGAGPGFAEVCFDCIPDTDAFLGTQECDNERFSPQTTHHQKHVKSILGVVMYYHDRDEEERRTLGIMSFDSNAPGSLSAKRYEMALPMLKVAYRALGIRLANICADPNRLASVYGRDLDLGSELPPASAPLDINRGRA